MIPEREPAESRLWLLTLVRLVGLAIILAGLWLAAGSGGAPPRLAGGLLLTLGGGALSLLLPRALARCWRKTEGT